MQRFFTHIINYLKVFNLIEVGSQRLWKNFGLLLIGMFLFANSAFAQIEVDNTSSTSANSGTSLTVSHTTGSGSNRFMLVGITTNNAAVTSVSYGGTALTLVGSQFNNNNSRGRVYIYRLINPAPGTEDVVVSFNTTISSGAVVGVTTFYGVHQTTPLNTFTSSQGTATTATLSDIPSDDNEVVYSVFSSRGRNITTGSGQTELFNHNSGTNRGAGSVKNGEDPSTSVTYTFTSAYEWALGAVSIRPISTADLSVSNIASEINPEIGEEVTITITAQNLGPDPSTGTSVTYNIPPGLSLVSYTASVGNYNPVTGVWNIPGNFTSGSTATLEVVAEVECNDDYKNISEISGNLPDLNSNNNTSLLNLSPISNIPTTIYLCAGQTYDFTQLNPCYIPANNIVTWHTGPIATNANRIMDPSSMGSGTYYGSLQNTIDGCYSPTQQFEVVVAEALSYTDSVIDNYCGNSGEIYITPAGGFGGYNYSWADGPTTQSRTNLPAGTYTLTLTDNSGCSDTIVANITIDFFQPITVSAFVSAIACNGDDNGFITLTVTGGTNPITYSWEGPNGFTSSSKDLTNLSAGVYNLTINDPNCTIERSYTITEPGLLNVSANVTQPICGTAGSIRLTITGGTAPFTYNWDDIFGVNNPRDRSNLDFGLYSVTVTDARGCTFSDTYELFDPNCPPAIYVCNNNQADVFSTPSDEDADTYTWTVPAGAVIVSGQGTPSIVIDWTGASVGLTQVCVYSTNACGESGNYCQAVIVSQVDATAFTSIGCLGDNLYLYSGGGSIYSWTGPNGFSSNLQNPIIFSPSSLYSGDYTVIVSNEGGCTDTASINVDMNPLVLLAASVTNSDCGQNTGAIDITTSGGEMPYSYLWSNAASTEDISNLYAGNYTLTVTDNNGCTDVITASVSDVEGPDISLVKQDISCNGSALGEIDLTVISGNGPYLYNWSNGANSQDISGLIAGNYGVVVTDALGCVSTANETLTEPNPLQLDMEVANVSCFNGSNGSINLTVTGGTPGYTYSWSTINGSGLAPSAEDQSGLTAGTYSFTVTDAAGCSQSLDVTLTQPNLLDVTATVRDVTCFKGADGSVEINVTGGTLPYTYLWSNGATTKNIYNLDSDSYSVVVTDRNGCTDFINVSVDEPDSFYMTANITNVSCFGDNDGAIALTIFNGQSPFSYEWSNNEVSRDIDELTYGSYTITVTDTRFCVAEATFEVTQPDQLQVSATVTNVSCFGGNNGNINVDVTGGTAPYMYQWSTSNGSGLVPNAQDQSTLTIGTYSLIVTDAEGCQREYQTAINQPTVLGFNYLARDARCFDGDDGEINLTAYGGTVPYSYIWSGGLPNMENQTGLMAGTYTVTVRDANLCEVSDTILIYDPPAIEITGSVTTVTCNRGSDGAVDINVTGGIGPYAYEWSNGGLLQDLVDVPSRNYIITVYDVNLCTKIDTFFVPQPPPVVVGAIVIPNCPGETNGSIVYTETTGGNPPYVLYSWSDIGPGPPSRFNLAPGTYTIGVTDSKGCTDSTAFELIELQISVDAVDRNCLSANGQVFSNPTDGFPPYFFDWSGPNGFTANTKDIANVDIGTYTVTITDSYGCHLTESAEVLVPSCIPPVAVNDTFVTLINEPVTGSVAPNDTDGDHALSELMFIPLTYVDPSQGVLVFSNDFDGSFTFTPAQDFVGTVTVLYQVCDPTDLCDVGVLHIRVRFDASWTLTKISTTVPNIYSKPGDSLFFDIFLENTGIIDIGNVVVNDPLAIAPPVYQSGDVNNDNILQPGEIWRYTVMCTITQADIDYGSFTNTATATGSLPIGSMDPVQGNDEVPADQRPSVSISMTALPERYDMLGEIIMFRMVVTNTGNVTLGQNYVQDSTLTILSDVGVIPPGQTDTAITFYAVTQDNLDIGYFVHRASVEGTFVSGRTGIPTYVHDTTYLLLMRWGFTPLPIELVVFKAEKTQDNKSLLTWVTASEVNNDYFEVQHSTDGVYFNVIGYVKGKGTTNELSTYNFTHDNPQIGVNYYKLRQVDLDGKSSYSDIRSLIFNVPGFDINLLGTITDSPFFRIVSTDNTTANIKMFTLEGRELFKTKVAVPKGISEYQMEIKDLASSLYIITYEDALGNRQAYKYFKD